VIVTPPYRTVILAGVKLYCEGLAQRLADTPLLVVDMTTTWTDAREKVQMHRPDVVLVDASSRAVLSHVDALRDAGPVTIVAFAVGEDEGDVIACAEAGVAAFVERSASIDDLIAATLRAVQGELTMSPRAAAALFRRVGTMSRPYMQPKGMRLTVREREVYLMLRDGMTNKDIAKRLGLRLPTVKNHVHHLLEKLGVHRRMDAVALTTRG
jgi:two-component system, NarL family, nitrate/nitrite response regulator NarL